MTTSLIISEAKSALPETTYEPTVQDKIQRVLYRLESGEQLVSGMLKHENNFCVLGLFTDESGLGHWNEYDCYVIDHEHESTVLSSILRDYYNLASNNAILKVACLPANVYNVMIKYDPELNQRDEVSLSEINDLLVENADPNTNTLLADVIRSRVIFKEFTNDYYPENNKS